MPAFAEGPLSGGARGNRARAGGAESESSSRGGRGLALPGPAGAAPRAPHRARFLQGMPPLSPEKPALCAGCGGKIADRYYLLAVDKQWHLRCLKCCECKLALESELTCFAKDGSIFCKEDYYRYSQPAPSRLARPPARASRSLRLSPAQGSPSCAPSNCSVPTPARLREEGAPGGGAPQV